MNIISEASIAIAEHESSRFIHTEIKYIEISGDRLAGDILSQVMFWFSPDKNGNPKVRVVKDGQFWLAKSHDEWYKELYTSRKPFDRAIKLLEEKRFIEKSIHRFGGKPTLHIRPIFENINYAIDKWKTDYARKIEELSNSNANNEPTSNENSPILTKCQNGNSQNNKRDSEISIMSKMDETVMSKMDETLTENTYTENTNNKFNNSNLIFVDNNKNLSMNTSIHNTSVVSTTDTSENHIEEVYFSQTGQIEISLSKAYEDIQLKRDTTSQEKITDFFLYFVERYTEHTGHKPYPIKYDKLITFVKRLVDSKLINGGRDSILNYDTDEIEWMIDDYFDYNFEDCNYSIHHFMSKKILSTRFRRLQNKYPKTA